MNPHTNTSSSAQRPQAIYRPRTPLPTTNLVRPHVSCAAACSRNAPPAPHGKLLALNCSGTSAFSSHSVHELPHFSFTKKQTVFHQASQPSPIPQGGKFRWLYSKIHGRCLPNARESNAKTTAKKIPASPKSGIRTDTPVTRQESERTTLQGEKNRATFFQSPELELVRTP